MTVAHLLYIPAILFVGLMVGYTLGRKAAEREAAEHNARMTQGDGGTSRRRRRRKMNE